MKTFRINKNISGKIRTKLCTEDVSIINKEVLSGFGIVEEMHFTTGDIPEMALIFKEPFRVPKFSKFYASKIRTVVDPYILEAVKRLNYLNPARKDTLMQKKITEYIINHFVATEPKESEIQVGIWVDHPIITFEELHPIVVNLLSVDLLYEPDTEDFILYSRGSKLDRDFKIGVKAQLRARAALTYFEKAIHTATEYLIDQTELVKVSHTRIRDTSLIHSSKGVASTQTIRKYMSERTKRVIDEHNSWSPFKSEGTYMKFEKFLNLPETMSADDIAEELGVSKSTVLDFRKALEIIN